MSEIYQRGPITCSVACDDKFEYGYAGGEANAKAHTGCLRYARCALQHTAGLGHAATHISAP